MRGVELSDPLHLSKLGCGAVLLGNLSEYFVEMLELFGLENLGVEGHFFGAFSEGLEIADPFLVLVIVRIETNWNFRL